MTASHMDRGNARLTGKEGRPLVNVHVHRCATLQLPRVHVWKPFPANAASNCGKRRS